MTEKDLINYWLTSAKDAWDTAQKLFELKKYQHSLFFCHLALEKLIKGLVVAKTHTHAQPIHNLLELAIQANIKLTSQREFELKEITSWNIKARYDNIKLEFYKKADEHFAVIWFNKAKEIYLWLKELSEK